MTDNDGPRPGQALLCRTCVRWSPDAWEAGHPSPCRRFRWNGDKHHAPVLVDGGCSDFEPLPMGGKAIAGKTTRDAAAQPAPEAFQTTRPVPPYSSGDGSAAVGLDSYHHEVAGVDDTGSPSDSESDGLGANRSEESYA